MAFLVIVLLIVGVVIDYILMLMFSQPFYILLDDPTKGVIQSMKESAQLMRGNKGRYFYILLSFIGWMLLGALSFGIGMLWVSAYLSATQVYFYMDITGGLTVLPVLLWMSGRNRSNIYTNNISIYDF